MNSLQSPKTFQCLGIPVPYFNIPGVGKWDRIMTYGKKIQFDAQGNGTPFDFNTETFCQIVDNFSRVYSARRMGLDYKHIAGNPEIEAGPEQNLGYYSGLAVIENGKVVKLWDHFPDRPPPNPAALLAKLQENFPRHTELKDIDGLWAHKCEITPLGLEKLPNCDQLSPYFSQNDTDEFGNSIGYNLINISAVGIAFQNGTTLSKPIPSSSPPLQAGDSTQTQKKSFAPSIPTRFRKPNTMNDMQPEVMAKLMAHGLEADTDKDKLAAAYAKYMSDTEDGPTERKKVSEEFAKCMAKFSDESDDKDKKDEDKTMNKMSKMQSQMISDLAAEKKELFERLSRLEEERKKREEAEIVHQATAFAKQAVDDGRCHPKSESKLVEMAKQDLKAAEAFIAPIPKGTFTVMNQFTVGGKPQGFSEVDPNAQGETRVGEIPTIGYALSKLAREYAQKNNISLSKAYEAVTPKKRSPLYG